MPERARRRDAAGFGFIEILITLVVVALASWALVNYMNTTVQSVETMRQTIPGGAVAPADRPYAATKYLADQSTLQVIRQQIHVSQAAEGRLPADRAAVIALLHGPPRFQCVDNDFTYDPSTGALALTITDASGCR